MSSSRRAAEPAFDEVNPEWTKEDFARSKRPEEVLPPEVLAAFPNIRRRGAQHAPTKVAVSIRLSRDVLEHFKAKGPNWQTRIDEALRKVIGG